MKLIRQIKLFFQEGTSDKVYEIDLCEAGDATYVVNFRYGKRGANLKDGTKTIFPVSMADATKVFDELEAEKRKKGYREQNETPVFVVKTSNGADKDELSAQKKTILKHLKTFLNGEEHETWPISRIVWRAGELKIKEAIPEMLKILQQKQNDFTIYSVVYLAARCGTDTEAILFLRDAYKRETLANYLKETVQAALLNICDEKERELLRFEISEALPQSIKQLYSEKKYTDLDKFLDEAFNELRVSANKLIYRLYLLSLHDEELKKIVLKHLSKLSLSAGTFRSIRRIYKVAEMIEDTTVLALLAVKIERQKENFTGAGMYMNGRWIKIKEELKKEDSVLAFSKNTKKYFVSRTVRTLNRLGEDHSQSYTKLATQILLQFSDKVNDASPQKTVKSDYKYNQATRTYEQQTKTTFFDSYSYNRAFYFILFKNSIRYKLNSEKTRLVCVAPFEPGKPFINAREEAFPYLWNEAPEEILLLLGTSKCAFVLEFAVQVFRDNPSFREKAGTDIIISLLSSDSEKVQRLGFELAAERYNKEQPDKKLVAALLACKIKEANTLAQDWIKQNPALFMNDEEFLVFIIQNRNLEMHAWLSNMLSLFKIDASVAENVTAKILSSVLSSSYDKNDEGFIYSLSEVLCTSIIPLIP
ncbi:MAG: WGR domain-containing protein, partial [Bacteroidia bacterium]|nr:WGR domain-containing protein [Bacteroidia bacterium]